MLSGCTSLFFQGSKTRYPWIDIDKLIYTEGSFPSEDGTQLRYWYFDNQKNRQAKPQFVEEADPKTRGIVVQFHGNAENRSTHYRGLAWILFYGYDFLTFDYRGYADSEGQSTVKGVNEDARAMVEFADRLAKEKNLPLILYGQSLGGSLLLKALGSGSKPQNLKLVVIESSFYSYKRIARQKMAQAWLLWPFQWLGYVLFSDRYMPGGENLKNLPADIPIVYIYSTQDPIVPVDHGELLYAETREPKFFWKHDEFGHINGMFAEKFKLRKELLNLLNEESKNLEDHSGG